MIENNDVVKVEYEPFDIYIPDISSEIRSILPLKDEDPSKLIKYLFEHQYQKHIILGQLCAWNKDQLVINCFEELLSEPVDLSLDINDHNLAVLLFHIYHISDGNFVLAHEVTTKLVELYIRATNHLSIDIPLNNDQRYVLNSQSNFIKNYAFNVLQQEGHTFVSNN